MRTATFFKSGAEVPSQEILGMEIRRAREMMALLSRKLGPKGMADLFAEEIRENEERDRVWSAGSDGPFTAAVTMAHVPEGSGAEFIEWFLTGYTGGNAEAMQRAHPEHLGALELPQGRVGAIETPGHTGTPMVVRLLPLDDWSGVPISLDPEMPHRIMARGETPEGETAYYLLHQFRDTSPGFDARLAMYLPVGAPESMVQGWSDHLMVEYHNWFCMYLQTRRQPEDLMPLALGANLD